MAKYFIFLIRIFAVFLAFTFLSPRLYSQAPAGYFPTWDQLIPDTTLTLKWTAVSGATSYIVEVATDNMFSNQIFYQNGIQTDTLIIQGLGHNQDYYWRVAVGAGTGSGIWSKTYKFNCFTPLGLSGLTLWLKAEKGITLTGQNVNSWLDQSGKGNHITQPTATNQPLYKTNSLNGYPAVSFDGSNDFMQGAAIPNLEISSLALFVIAKGNTQSGGSSNAKSMFSVGTTANGIWLARNTFNQMFMFYNKGTSLISVSSMPNTGFDFRIIEAIKNYGTSLDLYTNGTNVGTSANTTITGTFTNNNFCIGGSSATSGAFFSGEIPELVLVTGTLTVVERQKIEKYFSAKYDKGYINIGKDISIVNSVCDTSIHADPTFISYLWSTGDTTSSITINTSGSYWVRATDRFNFVSYDTVSVSMPDATLNIGNTNICYGDSVQLFPPTLNGITGLNYLWSTGATTYSIYASTGGSYSVKVTDSKGCYINSNIINLGVDMFPAYTTLGNDTTFCSGNFIKLQNPAFGYQDLTFLWKGGSQDSTLTITSSGKYWVQVTNQNSCVASDTIDVTISGTAPQTGFTYSAACAGDTTYFTDISVALFPDYVSDWFWFFGDGSISNVQNPSHKYTATGTYNVSLTATTAAGCSKTHTTTLTVNQKPSATFTTSPLNCINNNTYFFGQAAPASGDTITGYLWNFDDPGSGINNTSALLNPLHYYTIPGIYNVSLTAFTSKSCSQTITFPVTVLSSAPAAGNFSLISPYDNYITGDTNLTFSWSQSSNAVRYSLEISSDNLFNNIIGSYTYILSLSYNANLPSLPQYFWRVKAYNACNDSITSAIFSFQQFGTSIIPGMSFWFKANSGVSIENGTEVKIWSDFSGNGRHADQIVSNLRPAYVTNAINNLPAVRFGKTGTTGSRTYLDFNNAAYTNGNFTVFTVYKAAAINKIIHYVISGGSSSNFTGGCHAGGTFTGLEGYGLYDAGAQNARNSTEEPTNWGIVTHYNNKLFRNGKEANYSLQGTVNTMSLNRIGTRLDNAEFFFYGDIAEIIAYDNKLNTQHQLVVEEYLRYKYAGPPVDLGPDLNIAYGFCNVTLNAGTRFTSYLWSTGATTSQININNGGTYWVSVTDIFGYVSTDTIVINKPSLNLNNTSFCEGSNITINSGVAGNYAYLWSNNGTSSSVTLNIPGLYSLIITDTLGCSITDSFILSVDNFSSTASLGPDTSFCAGNSIGLLAGSAQAFSYLWNDGSTNSTLIITTGGNYSVTATSINNCTAIDTVNLTILGDAPYVDFGYDSVCVDKVMTFNNLSYPLGSSTITSYLWDFDNGQTSVQTNPTTVYNYSGIYNVSLTATTDVGCASTKYRNTVVYPLPLANFQPNNGCTGQPIAFEDLSQNISGNIISHLWNFNNPYTSVEDTSTIPNPVFIYDSAGVYQVSLTVTNDKGCSHTVNRDVTIRTRPAVDFSASPTCLGATTYFADITNVNSWEPITEWQWDFGDGNYANISTPIHQYDSAKTYQVTLTVRSLNGCQNTITKAVTVNPLPLADFTTGNSCVSLPVQFIDNSSISNGNIVGWLWLEGNNPFSQIQNPIHIFPDTGYRQISLQVTSDAGCKNSVTNNIKIESIPTSSFTFSPDFGVPPLQVSFTNNSTGATNVLWDFGDGNFSASINPTHIYSDTGYFTISLISVNDAGCTDTVSKNIFVMPFTADIAMVKAQVTEGNSYLSFSADLTNLGTINLRELELTVYISGGIEFSEIWKGLLPPGASMNYLFNAKYRLSSEVPREYVCISAIIPDFNPDNNQDNNEKCIAVKENFHIAELYPNPAKNTITADIILPDDDNFIIQIISSTGNETLHYYSKEGVRGMNRYKINIDNLNNGVYALRVIFRDKSMVKMFIKQ